MKYQPRDRVNSYLTKEVADVCLKCKLKRCLNLTEGCEAYREAVRSVSHKTSYDGKLIKVTVRGETHSIREWADLLGVSKSSMYSRANVYGRSMADEIEVRLKEREKANGKSDDPSRDDQESDNAHR